MGRGIFGIFNRIIKYHDFDLDKPVYRFLSLERFESLIQENSIYFRKITKWNDTWEIPARMLDTRTTKNDDMTRFVEAILSENKRLYGLCFTTTYDTDAMWQIYSQDKKGVCIQTTMRKFINCLNKTYVEYGAVGPVLYKKIINGNSLFNLETSDNTYPAICYFPFIKRIEFSHENEVRLVLRLDNIFSDDGVKLKIDILNCIDKIILDPRLSNEEFNDIKNRIALKKIDVLRSGLYKKDLIYINDSIEFWDNLNRINTGRHAVSNDCFTKINGEWADWELMIGKASK